MKIYLISTDDHTYDCISNFVIVANNEDEVREIAMDECMDEGEKAWVNAVITEQGIYTGSQTEPFYMLYSFHGA